MSTEHEIDRLNFSLAGLFAEEALSAIASDPAYKAAPAYSQQPIPLLDHRWFMACVYVVGAMVIGGLISLVIA